MACENHFKGTVRSCTPRLSQPQAENVCLTADRPVPQRGGARGRDPPAVRVPSPASTGAEPGATRGAGRSRCGCASPCGPRPRVRFTPRPTASSLLVSLRGHRVTLRSLATKKKQKEKPPRLYFPSGQVRSIGFTGLSDNSEGTERCRPDTVGRSRQPDGGRKLPARSCFYCPTYQDHPDGPVGPTRGSAAIPEQLRAVVCSGKVGHEVFEDR